MAEVRLFKTTTFRDRNVNASKTYIVFEQLITAEGNGSVWLVRTSFFASSWSYSYQCEILTADTCSKWTSLAVKRNYLLYLRSESIEPVAETILDPAQSGWLDVDVTSQVQNWLMTCTSNLRFRLSLRNEQGFILHKSYSHTTFLFQQ